MSDDIKKKYLLYQVGNAKMFCKKFRSFVQHSFKKVKDVSLENGKDSFFQNTTFYLKSQIRGTHLLNPKPKFDEHTKSPL